MVKRWRISLMCLVLAMAACQMTELYHNLTEEDANAILVALQESGINAKKEKETVQNEVSWTVKVATDKIGEARNLLVSRNLPRRKELGLSGVYKDKGFIPTPDEQKARFLLAQKGEIINSLLKIPEVVDVDVVLNIPTAPVYGSAAAVVPPTASVVVKVRDVGGTLPINEERIQQFVANAVESLNAHDVAVIISYVEAGGTRTKGEDNLVLPSAVSGKKREPIAKVEGIYVTLAGLDVAAHSSTRLLIYIGVFLGLLIALAVGLIITVVRANRFKQELESAQPIEGEIEAPARRDQLMPPE